MMGQYFVLYSHANRSKYMDRKIISSCNRLCWNGACSLRLGIKAIERYLHTHTRSDEHACECLCFSGISIIHWCMYIHTYTYMYVYVCIYIHQWIIDIPEKQRHSHACSSDRVCVCKYLSIALIPSLSEHAPFQHNRLQLEMILRSIYLLLLAWL